MMKHVTSIGDLPTKHKAEFFGGPWDGQTRELEAARKYVEVVIWKGGWCACTARYERLEWSIMGRHFYLYMG